MSWGVVMRTKESSFLLRETPLMRRSASTLRSRLTALLLEAKRSDSLNAKSIPSVMHYVTRYRTSNLRREAKTFICDLYGVKKLG